MSPLILMLNSLSEHPSPTPYADLSPDRILDAVESIGLPTTATSWRSTATRTGSTRSASTRPSRLSPSSTARALERRGHPGGTHIHPGLADAEIPAVAPFDTGAHPARPGTTASL